MQVVDICRALYKISSGTPASRGPSATAGLLVELTLLLFVDCHMFNFTCHAVGIQTWAEDMFNHFGIKNKKLGVVWFMLQVYSSSVSLTTCSIVRAPFANQSLKPIVYNW